MRSFLRFLYQFYKWLVFIPLLIISTLLLGGCVIIGAYLFPNFKAHRFGIFWSRVVAFITPVKVEAQGKEHIDPGRSYIVIANHQSYYDIIGMMGWLGMDIKFIMKKELGKIPIFGLANKSAGNIFVDRSDRKKAIKSLNESVNKLRPGQSVIIYPEGRRSRTGELQPFKKGAFRLAQNTGMPLLPVSVEGTPQIQPPDTFFLFPGKIKIKVHPPIDSSEYTDHEEEKGLEQMMDRSWKTIHEGMEELGEGRRR